MVASAHMEDARERDDFPKLVSIHHEHFQDPKRARSTKNIALLSLWLNSPFFLLMLKSINNAKSYFSRLLPASSPNVIGVGFDFCRWRRWEIQTHFLKTPQSKVSVHRNSGTLQQIVFNASTSSITSSTIDLRKGGIPVLIYFSCLPLSCTSFQKHKWLSKNDSFIQAWALQGMTTEMTEKPKCSVAIVEHLELGQSSNNIGFYHRTRSDKMGQSFYQPFSPDSNSAGKCIGNRIQFSAFVCHAVGVVLQQCQTNLVQVMSPTFEVGKWLELPFQCTANI